VTASHIASWKGVLAAWALALVLASAGGARAGDTEDARAYAEKATAAFALAKYAVAAEYFEKAFELRADPALLYNAAQSHRLGGNKERALVLYRNYLRLYAKKENRSEIEARVDELTKAIAHDKAVETKPPNTTQPIAGGSSREDAVSPKVAPALSPTPPPSEPVALVARPAPPAEGDSLLRKPWFWVATGSAIAAAVTVVLLVSLGGSRDPSPSVGRINAN
jgi:tetratricopeptide (TPR) repeat protein